MTPLFVILFLEHASCVKRVPCKDTWFYGGCAVTFTLKTNNGDLVEASPEDGVEFTLASGYLIPAFKLALEEMKKGEEVNLVIAPQCAILAHSCYQCKLMCKTYLRPCWLSSHTISNMIPEMFMLRLAHTQ
jgi:FKBP-type peptidyl-prolyl cis-trans isomerase